MKKQAIKRKPKATSQETFLKRQFSTIIVIAIALIITVTFVKQAQNFFLRAQTTAINPASASFPAKVFSPYVDVTAFPTFDFANDINTTGQKYYTLAFIVNGGGTCIPEWGGVTPLSQNFLYDQINLIRSKGGDVIVSFGGAAGIELGQSCTTVQTLQAAYQQVISQYKLHWIDLDIEGGAIGDTASIDRRNRALAGLQAANPGLKVSYTLPVLPSGLTQDGLNLLSNAKTNGVNISVVNVMAMDYGDASAPSPTGKMGQYALDSVNSTITQVKNLGITNNFGITPMIGQNDTTTESTSLTDAQQIVTAASSIPGVTFLSMWSSNRDFGTCAGQGSASPTCSGIAQSPLQFTTIFQKFMVNAPVSSPAPTAIQPTLFCLGGVCPSPTTPAVSTPTISTAPTVEPTVPQASPTLFPTQAPISVQPSPQATVAPTQQPTPPAQGAPQGFLALLRLLIQIILQLFSHLTLF